MLLKEKVINALRKVEDPDLKKDLVTLNMVRELEVTSSFIRFSIQLTTPACPLKEFIKQACVHAIHREISESFEIDIKFISQVTSHRINASLLPYVKNIIAIASGKGGVGKSTLASNLALALAQQGAQVGLLDADIFGPSIPVMWGCSGMKPDIVQESGQDWFVPLEKHGVKLLSIGFLSSPNEAIVWRGPMASAALKQLIKNVIWGSLDYLLVDLPPGTGDIHLTLVQTVSITGVVIVTTPQKVALIDAFKGILMFRKSQINIPILGLIENMAYFTPEELPKNTYYIFGKAGGKILANEQNIPFLGQVPLIQKIREQGDLGMTYNVTMGRDSVKDVFDSIAMKLAQQVAIYNAYVG